MPAAARAYPGPILERVARMRKRVVLGALAAIALAGCGAGPEKILLAYAESLRDGDVAKLEGTVVRQPDDGPYLALMAEAGSGMVTLEDALVAKFGTSGSAKDARAVMEQQLKQVRAAKVVVEGDQATATLDAEDPRKTVKLARTAGGWRVALDDWKQTSVSPAQAKALAAAMKSARAEVLANLQAGKYPSAELAMRDFFRLGAQHRQAAEQAGQ
jgi:hypothetical protein